MLTLRYGEVGLLPVELNFSDVTEDDWFYKYILMATHLEVVSGFEDGTFKPFMEITYPQFLKMMVGVFKLPVNMPPEMIVNNLRRLSTFVSKSSQKKTDLKLNTESQLVVLLEDSDTIFS